MTRPRSARRRLIPVALGALAVAMGAAGLYASSLSVNNQGSLGAGSTTVSASCDSTIYVQVGPAVWDETLNAYASNSLVVTDIDAVACAGADIEVALGTEWTDPDTGESGTETSLIASSTITGTTVTIDFTIACDIDGDGVADVGCTDPYPVPVDDFDTVSVLIQSAPAPVDQVDA